MTAAAVTRELIRLLVEAADLAQDTIRPCAERRERDDVLADQSVDDTVVALLVGQGLTVRSEESGTTGPAVSGRHTVLLDPLDGSRNFRLGVPWYAFSACVLTDGRPRIGLVRNLATGETTLGVHGQGAWALRHGGWQHLTVAAAPPLDRATVVYAGRPARPVPGDARRNLGSSALELCAVARGNFHVFVDLSRSGTESWDHSAGMLIATAAGAAVGTRHSAPGRFGTGVFSRRHLVVAASPQLLADALSWADEAAEQPRE